MQTERRYTAEQEVRVAKTGDSAVITGYGAVFNRDSQPLGWDGFIERIAPGAFRKTLKDGADVRALFNHNPDFVLGRNKSGTLRLSEDSTGLHYEVDIDLENTDVRNVFRMIERGDVSQSSFGFTTVQDEWTQPEENSNEPVVRTLKEVRLFDVSPVTYPAYLDTEVDVKRALRSLSDATGTPLEVLEEAATQNDLRNAIAPHEDTPEPAKSHSRAVPARIAMRMKELGTTYKENH